MPSSVKSPDTEVGQLVAKICVPYEADLWVPLLAGKIARWGTLLREHLRGVGETACGWRMPKSSNLVAGKAEWAFKPALLHLAEE